GWGRGGRARTTAGAIRLSVAPPRTPGRPCGRGERVLVRGTQRCCRARVSQGSGANVQAHFSVIFPANCVGSRCIVMRGVLREDVRGAKPIVRDGLMRSTILENAAVAGRAWVSLMPLGAWASPTMVTPHAHERQHLYRRTEYGRHTVAAWSPGPRSRGPSARLFPRYAGLCVPSQARVRRCRRVPARPGTHGAPEPSRAPA